MIFTFQLYLTTINKNICQHYVIKHQINLIIRIFVLNFNDIRVIEIKYYCSFFIELFVYLQFK